MTKTKEVAVSSKKEVALIDPEVLAEVKDLYPVDDGSAFTRIKLPRIDFASQDVMEGEGKAKKCILEAGTFSISRETDEIDEEGKKVWSKEEIGPVIEGVILTHRYQLSYYDEETEKYTSSPVYDSKDEVLPLWCEKKEVAKGTPAELKALYKFVDKDGKEKSKLKDNRILYVLYKDELFQLSLHGSSMFSFMKYVRTVVPPTVLTRFQSDPQEKGTIKWNMMTFTPVESFTTEKLQDIKAKIMYIKMAISAEKGNQTSEVPTRYVAENAEANKKFDEINAAEIKF